MSDDDWEEFAKLGQNRNKNVQPDRQRSDAVKPSENREKKPQKRDSVDSWDFDAKPKTASSPIGKEQPKYQAQNIKSAGFGDFDDIVEGKKAAGNKM